MIVDTDYDLFAFTFVFRIHPTRDVQLDDCVLEHSILEEITTGYTFRFIYFIFLLVIWNLLFPFNFVL